MMNEQQCSKLQAMLDESHNICVFTGAGISCPSGIPDFRSADGLYNQQSNSTYTPEEMVSHSFFESHPEQFFEFYKTKMVWPNAKPNAAHRFFAALEQHGKQVCVVTQNIDGLHQAAGSTRVLELHGSVLRNYCTRCGAFYDVNTVLAAKGVPHCPKDGGIIKPDVVLYEECLDETVIEQAVQAIEAADMLVVTGTSLAVYPAASFVRYYRGDRLAVLNLTPTQMDLNADLAIYDDIEAIVQRLH